MKIEKVLPCEGECAGFTDHQHRGANRVKRDVWVCLDCGATRSGPILTRSDVDQAVATDGGEER